MQSGLVYGQIGQTEYIIKKVKEEMGLDNIKVVATGGLGRIIANETEAIDVYDPTTGLLSPLQTVLYNIYGASRENALTATEYDGLELTASVYDGREITAFDYDNNGKEILMA